MRRTAVRWLIAPLVVTGSLAIPSAASATHPAPIPLTTTPFKCAGDSGGGCYASDAWLDQGEGALDDTGNMVLNIAPKVMRPGDRFTATLAYIAAGHVNDPWPSGGFKPNTTDPCTKPADHKSCSYLGFPVSETHWGIFTYGLSNSVEEDYYAVTNRYGISGTVRDASSAGGKRLFPNAGVEVTARGDNGAVFRASTSPKGNYTIFVDPGTNYAVSTAGKHCYAGDLPTCHTSKTFPVAPDQEGIDFEAPPFYKVSGALRDEDGAAVKGVTIRADAVGGGRIESATTNAQGLYELAVPAGDIRMSADDPRACVVAAGDECPKTKDIEVAHNVTVDFKLAGCSTTVDFETSMVAIGECFEKLNDHQWQTDEKFRMNGIDIVPTGKVKFDKNTQRVEFGEAKWNVDSKSVAGSQLSEIDFSRPTVTFKPAANIDFYGVENSAIDDALTFDFTAGQTVITAQAKIPRAFTFKKNDKGEQETKGDSSCKGTVPVKLALTTTNADGLRKAAFETDPSQIFCFPKPPGASDPAVALPDPGLPGGAAPGPADPEKSPTKFSVSGLSGAYDLTYKWWEIGGKLRGIPLLGKTLDGKGNDLSLKLVFDDKFHIRQFSGSGGPELNKQIPVRKDMFMQSVGINIGRPAADAPAAFGLTGGFSWGPKDPFAKKVGLPGGGFITLLPEYAMYLDASLSYSDKDGLIETVQDAQMSGSGSLKVYDYPILQGVKVAYLPGPQAFIFNGTLALSDPTGGFFTFTGNVNSWLDATRGIFFAQGRVNASIAGFAPTASTMTLHSRKGVAVCLTDALSPEGFGASMQWGDGITLANALPKVGGCDIGRFTDTPPKAKVAALRSAGSVKRFTVPGGTDILLLEVTGSGTGAPVVQVSGPGAKVTSNAAKGVKKGAVTTIPAPASNMTYIVLRKPKAGRWTLSPKKGGIKTVRFGNELPEPQVTGKLSGDACSPTLAYSIKPMQDQKVTIVDQGADGSNRILVEDATKSGTVQIPAIEGGGRRTILAQVFNGVTVRRTINLGSYGMPNGKPAAPRGLLVRAGKKGKLTVSWKAVCGATEYSVKVGGGKATRVKATKVSVKAPKNDKTQVRVTSIGAGGATGGSTSRALVVGSGGG